MKSRTIMVASLLVILAMACSFTTSPGGTPPNQGSGGGAPNPEPVSINDGLASLNSYEMTVIFKSVGPNPGQSSTVTIRRLRSNDSNASSSSFNTVASGPGGEDPAISDTFIYQIGNDQCSGNDTDGWSWSSTSPAEAEMQGLVANMIGLTPLIDQPVFVAAETINGIPANHFTFQVPGLGASSGAVVNINRGDYWLAVDGRYIVKYTLVIETSLAADADVLHEEISIEMNQVNQAVNITFPQACQEASRATP